MARRGEQAYEEAADSNLNCSTRVFSIEDRYFDIQVEYAKASAEDICIRVEAFNRGPDATPLHLIPHLWFRNTWCWGDEPQPEPSIRMGSPIEDAVCLIADDSTAAPLENLPFTYRLGKRYLYAESSGTPLFTDNESNTERLYGVPNKRAFQKDAFHRAIVNKEAGAVNPNLVGTKACIDYEYTVPARRFRRPQTPADARAFRSAVG